MRPCTSRSRPARGGGVAGAVLHLGANLAKDKYFGEAAEPLQRLFVFGGAAGVAFFFVLSGFIIVLIHGREIGHPAQLWPYLRKRLARIYPTYLLTMVTAPKSP
ncbi:acyltransferase family protein [Variovorax sp. J22P240]|uniref:acyltransferase family protein n=1 Tax=Variovorax sp. J22P240 TaxID=3053514 RepID=UPI0025785B54|nr:acyltransferase family protein [Variovorax sp. J22P240]MDM0002978.1 acyltransferase family protein [Variovorax sp. J22P240]